jgi:hypothetical protein
MPERRLLSGACLRAAATVAALLAVGLLGAACGEPERTVRTYCERYERGFDEMKRDYPDVDQYASSDAHPLAMLLSIGSAYGDMVALLGEMAEVSPDEIQSDVERVHETLDKQLKSAGDVISDPWGALAGQLVASVTSSGAFARVDAYTLEHCGEHLFAASPQRG